MFLTRENIPEEQINTVIIMLIVRASFKSVGHFFRPILLRSSSAIVDSILASYDSFKYKRVAYKLREAGEDLLNILLMMDRRKFRPSHEKIKRAFVDAADVNSDAAFIVDEFIKNGFSAKLEQMALEEWNPYYLKDPYFLDPFFGCIVVDGEVVLESNEYGNGYKKKWAGGVRLRFKLFGSKGNDNWVIHSIGNKKELVTKIRYALPGWAVIEAPLRTRNVTIPLVFKFPIVIKRGKNFGHAIFETVARTPVVGRAVPEWRGKFITRYVKGDLTLIEGRGRKL